VLELDVTHREIRDAARAFARDRIAPHAKAWDEAEHFPLELMAELGKLGFLGIQIPERFGGAGLDTLAYAIIVEEVSYADGAMGLTVASHNGLGSSHIARFGSEALHARYLPKLATGEYLGAWALTEPGSGSDAGALYTYPGFSLHDELALLVRAGVPPVQAIRLASGAVTEFLGLDDSLGTIAPGKVADLLILDADPVRDIRNTKRIRSVIYRGRLLDREALDLLLARGRDLAGR